MGTKIWVSCINRENEVDAWSLFLRAKTSEMARHEGTKGFFMSICGIIIRKYSVFLSWKASNNQRREVGCYGYRAVLLESDACPLVFSPRALTLIPELMHEPLFSAFLHQFPDFYPRLELEAFMNHYEIVRRNYSALFPQYEKLSTICLVIITTTSYIFL